MGIFNKAEEKIEEVIGKKPIQDKKVDEKKLIDCPDCKGTGLIYHEGTHKDEVCINCQGKGKIN